MKRNKKIFAAIAAIILGSTACNAQLQELNVKVDTSKQYQTIDHFTASDAWSGNFIGQYWAEREKSQVAKWLFSQKLDKSGNPEGIGLSLWRINIGGGTLEQDGADIQPYQRRAESFLTKDGKSYDWSKANGQQYFMTEAKRLGCEKFLLFSNTPPVQWTINGKGYAQKGSKSNLRPECYGNFAKYIVDVAEHFEEKGFNIVFVSPINEPQVDWNSPRQEGSTWMNSEMKKVFVELDKAIEKSKLKNTKILVGESANYRLCYEGGDTKYNDKTWDKDNIPQQERPKAQIKTFFDKKSQNYIGDLKNVHKVWAAHAYDSAKRFDQTISEREKVFAEAQKYGVGFLQTEWCMLPNFKAPSLDGFTCDWKGENWGDMQVALVMARIIAADLAIAQSQGWGYWKGMELKGNHALVAAFPSAGNEGNQIEKGGNVRANKLLWTLGNFSFFIRPDYKRVDISGANDIGKVFSTAFMSPDGKKLVLVFVNSSFDKADVSINLPEDFSNATISVFRTDERCDLANMNVNPKFTNNQKVLLAPRSVTTVWLSK